MQLLKRITLTSLLALACGLALASSASAQLIGPGSASRNTWISAAAGNLNSALPYIPEYNFGSVGDSNGAFITYTDAMGNPTTVGSSFTGLDSQGNQQTMTFTAWGQAQADYGVLHALAGATITDLYYNESNPTFYTGDGDPNPDGSPQYLDSVAHASFTDTLTLTGNTAGVVGIRYLFHIEGVTGDNGYAVLGFNAGSNGATFFSDDPTTPDWATPEWSVAAGTPIDISADFAASYGANTTYYTDTEGAGISGTADFFDTLTLTGIQLLDANGNQVNGVSYLTASGTHYDVLGGVYGGAPSSVPEPGGIALLAGLGLPGLAYGLKRRQARLA